MNVPLNEKKVSPLMADKTKITINESYTDGYKYFDGTTAEQFEGAYYCAIWFCVFCPLQRIPISHSSDFLKVEGQIFVTSHPALALVEAGLPELNKKS